MYRKMLSCALAVSTVIGMSSFTALGAEAAENEVPLTVSLSEYPLEQLVGNTDTLSVFVENVSDREVSLDGYDVKVVVTEGADQIALAEPEHKDMVLQPADEWSSDDSAVYYVEYTPDADCTAAVIKVKAQLCDEEGNLLAESDEQSIYPYTISDGVLTFNDTAKDKKYEIKIETVGHVTYTGPIYGGDGDATEVWVNGKRTGFYIHTGHPSSFGFELEDGYGLGDVELIPSDAGTIQQYSGSTNFGVDLHAPATLRVTGSTQSTLSDGNGFSISVPGSAEMESWFSGMTLVSKEYADQADIDELVSVMDKHGRAKAYELTTTILGDVEYPELKDITVTMPIPEGWDGSRIKVLYKDEYSIGALPGTVSEDGKSISFDGYNFVPGESNVYYLLEESIPTEVKDWEETAAKFIANIRYITWTSDAGFPDLTFEGTPSAEVAGMIAYQMSAGMFDTYSEYYNHTKNQAEVPYDVFYAEAEKYFVNVPDLKLITASEMIYYDKDLDAIVLPFSGMGDAPNVTEIVKTEDLGYDQYAIRFKLSYKTAVEEPDMNDPDQYMECTLVVKDGGQGEWQYVSFLEGYPEVEPIVPEEPEDPTPEEPENPGTEEPGTGEPENPGTEEPGTEEPENPGTEEPGTEEPGTEEPGTDNPGTDKPAEEVLNVEEAVSAVEKAAEGTSVAVSMGSTTVVPEEVLSAAQGKDVNVVLQMDGYTWTINGKSVSASSLKDIDLAVKTDVNAIPADVVKRLANGNATKQFTLAHDGAFGFTAELKIYMGTGYSGKYGNLFWYDNDKKINFIDASKIGADGYVSFTMDHASDYVVVVNKQELSEINVPLDLRPTKTGSTDKTGPTPETRDSANVFVYVIVMGAAAATALMVLRRKSRA